MANAAGQDIINSISGTDFDADLTRNGDLIEEVTGRRPIYFRFPKFETGSHGSRPNALGMAVIHARFDSRDFNAQTPLTSLLRNGGSSDGTPFGNINNGGWDGVIQLWHDAGGDASSNMYTQNNAIVIRDAVPELQAIGYAFVTVEELWTIKGLTPAPGGGGPHHNGMVGVPKF
jgi:peptidoglycan/xylan/chitin deacetylase (PgdA/CDA1 family)